MALTRPRYSQIYDTDYKQSVRVATTADVGNLLVAGNLTNTIDGKTLQANDRILVKDQTDAKQNGIYYVATVGTGSNGTWVRALDADANVKVTSGMTTTISEGDVNISKTYKLSTPDPIYLGVTELTFINPFAGGSAAGGNTHVQFNDGGVAGGSAGLTFNKVGNVLTVGGNINVTGSILPSANVTYDLGSPTQRWRDGWFSGTTIHIGTESMSVGTDGTWAFTSGGATVQLGIDADFNPPNANISGNVTATNYLFANGTPLMTVVNTMISVANTAMKGYADGEMATLTSNAAVQAGDIATLYANAGAQSGSIVTANTAMKGYVDGEISTTTSAITTANTAMKGYVDGQISTTTSAITTANTAMKGYVDGINSTLTSNAAVQAGLIASKANLSGASFTGNISVPYIVGSTVIDGNLNISGNLNVTGVETIFNTNNLVVNDSLIYLADDNTGDVLDIGIVSSFTNPTYQHTGFVRDAGDGVWKLFANVVAEPTTTIDFTNATYSNLRVGNLITSTVTYANGQSILTNVESAITTANTAMKGYVDAGLASLSSDKISSSGSNVTVTTDYVNVAIAGTNVASVSSTGIKVTNIGIHSKANIGTTRNSNALEVGSGIGVWDVGALVINSTPHGQFDQFGNITRILAYGGPTWSGEFAIYQGSTNASPPLAKKFSLDASGNANIYSNSASISSTTGALVVSGGAGIAGTVYVNSNNGAIAIGNGGTTGVGNIGASGAAFNTVFAKSTSAQYADLAEVYTGDRNYIPGTVLVFGGTSEVTVSLTSHDPSVAGVVSTNPAYLMNDRFEGVAVALQGRVPCRVLGPVKKGDRVVTSDVRGVAQRLDPAYYQPGCIIGKALGSVPDGEITTIEVVVGRN